jgi:hypothetical protein
MFLLSESSWYGIPGTKYHQQPLSAWQVILSSAVTCLKLLVEWLRIQSRATKSMHPIISGEVHAIIGRVPETIN